MGSVVSTYVRSALLSLGEKGWRTQGPSWACFAVYGLLAANLSTTLLQYTSFAVDALGYPYEIDYGEGIVWQQAELILSAHAYADIAQYPYIVFHYPPIYHLLVRTISVLSVDILTVGRGLSVTATCIIIALIGWLVAHGTDNSSQRVTIIAGPLAGLLLLTFTPVQVWSLLMRVDMVALSFSLGGVACAVASLRRPTLLYAAVFLFVLAVFTKQTLVAAPLATLSIVLVRTPRQGARAVAFGVVLGGGALAALASATGGGFVRHIFLYNLNRFDFNIAIDATLMWLCIYAVYAGLVAIALMGRWRLLRPEWQGLSGAVHLIRHDDNAAWSTIMAAYLILATASLATAGKSGAAENYFLEWFSVICIWLGVGIAQSLAAIGQQNTRRPLPGRILAAVLVPFALLAQQIGQPSLIPRLHAGLVAPANLQAGDAMLELLRGIRGPVLSEEMVLLLRAGKQVSLEPAIFAELAATGRWQEAHLLDMLNNHVFGAVITVGGPGDAPFNARYLPRTQAAILDAYPKVQAYGNYQVRLPN